MRHTDLHPAAVLISGYQLDNAPCDRLVGLNVAKDTDTRQAMQLAVYRLLDEEWEPSKGKRFDKIFFNILEEPFFQTA